MNLKTALIPFLGLLILTGCDMPIFSNYPKHPLTATQIAGTWLLELPQKGVRDSHTQKRYPTVDSLTLILYSNGTYSWTFKGPKKISYGNTWKFSENDEQHQALQLNYPRYRPETLDYAEMKLQSEVFDILLGDGDKVILCYQDQDAGPPCFSQLAPIKK